MTSKGNGQPAIYTVSMSRQTRETLRETYLQALAAGRGQEFLAAFRQIVGRLRTDPLIFGEALYPLPALRLQVRLGAVAPLAVDYAVHEERPLVFIKSCKALS